MKVMLLLSIHALLMLIYAAFVATGRSRMHWLHLLLALVLPFAGEFCLLLAELDSMPASPLYTSPFHRKRSDYVVPVGARLPDNWRELLQADEASARSFLLDSIARNCYGLTDVLHEALHVSGSEIPHIAASTLMKLHAQHEKCISIAQNRYENSQENVVFLRAWIDAVDAYRLSGLNDCAALQVLEQEEISLIHRYLFTMQNDTHYRPILIALLMKDSPKNAYDEALIQLKLLPEDPESWNMTLESCRAAHCADYNALLHKLRLVSALWYPEQRQKLRKWEEIHHVTES